MTPFWIILIPVIFFALIISVIIYFATNTKKVAVKRKLKKEIKSVSDGETAKIIGKVTFIEPPLIAPLTGRGCAYYYVEIRKDKVKNGNHYFETLIEEEVSNKFLIKSKNFYAYINTKNIKSYIVPDKKLYSDISQLAPGSCDKYLLSKGINRLKEYGRLIPFYYYEGILESEEKIAVYGKCKWKSSRDLELPVKYGRVLEITPNGEEPVFLSDATSTTREKKY